jgi:hypothetical protein
LDPWALLLVGYDYRIRDIAEDANVWADLLPRWGSTSSICTIFRMPLKVAPPNFVLPTLEDIKQLQEAAVQERNQLPLTVWGGLGTSGRRPYASQALCSGLLSDSWSLWGGDNLAATEATFLVERNGQGSKFLCG